MAFLRYSYSRIICNPNLELSLRDAHRSLDPDGLNLMAYILMAARSQVSTLNEALQNEQAVHRETVQDLEVRQQADSNSWHRSLDIQYIYI